MADAIRTKAGTSGTIQASAFDTAISNIPSGGGGTVEEKDVNFYDYEGTLLYSYTAQEFQALDSMPENPTHEGLTSQGWNWTLEQAKSYVTNHGICDIGQMYTPTDGKIDISFNGNYFNNSFGSQSNTLTVQYRYKESSSSSWGTMFRRRR